MDRPPAPRPPMLGVALIALSALALQVSLTRVFSLLIWYHFAFLAVAIALLGFTGGGVLVQLRPEVREGDLDERMARLSYGFALSVVGTLFVATQLPFGPSVLADATQFAYFVVLVLVVLVPFLLAGTVVAVTLSSYGASASRLYAADLLGSGVGCALSALALDHLGGGAGGVMLSAVTGALAGLVFSWRARTSRARWMAAGAALLALLIPLTVKGRDPLHGPFYLPNAKLFPRVPKEAILARRCDSTACVDFFLNPWHHGIWGLATNYRGPVPNQVGIVIDAWAVTSIFEAERRPDGSPELRHPVFESLIPSFVHRVNRAQNVTPERMLIIGAGGGVDIRAALHFGVHRVEAVDINRTILDGVARDFDRFAGGIYHRPDVFVTRSEGRHYLRRSPFRYDLVQISGVDTYAASQAGAFALSENFLYTVEAFAEYLQHLTPDGTLTLTRWLYKPPRHTLRLCTIADRAYREMGLGDASRHVVIVSTHVPELPIELSLVLAKRRPFRDDELRAIRQEAQATGFDVIWSPDGRSPDNEFGRYFRSNDRDAYVRDYHFRIEPTTDDTPFFFEHNRFMRLLSSREVVFGAASGQMLLVVTFALVLASAALVLGLPSWLLRRRDPARHARLAPAWQTYFLALGVGYIAVETVLIPKFSLFLGNPVHALSVVLFSLLVASGVGSALSARLVRGDPRRLTGVAAAIVVTLVAYAFGLKYAFDAALSWPFPARVATAALLLAVPGVLMGMPFPSGVAMLSERTSEGDRASAIARAWVLNGYASVAGSVGAMILAIAQSFSAVIVLGALCYALAAVMALSGARARADAAT